MTASGTGLAVEGARALLGAADLVRPPQPSASSAGGERPFPPLLHRVLGVRQVAQAVVTARAGSAARSLGGGVDALHALSMVAVAACSPRYRRAAIAQVLVASALALLELRTAPSGSAAR